MALWLIEPLTATPRHVPADTPPVIVSLIPAPTVPAPTVPAPEQADLPVQNKVIATIRKPSRPVPHPPRRKKHAPAHKTHPRPTVSNPQASSKAASAETRQTSSPPAPAAPVISQAAVPVASPQPIHHARSADHTEYLSQLIAHIQRHKHYPRLARRRHQQGDVTVRFLVHHDGHITALQTGGATAILRKACQQAVQEALPLPRPAGNLPADGMPVHFIMRFRLTGHSP